MRAVLPYVSLGFCTDGDWVDTGGSPKLIWLPQGADGRITGPGRCDRCALCGSDFKEVDVLFTGNGTAGAARRTFVEEMTARWGPRFRHVPSGLYRERLRDAVAGARIVVAPDYPVSDRYWSNRVYTALGFGAFLLHRSSEGLEEQYPHGRGLVYYDTRDELHGLIEKYLDFPGTRAAVAEEGLRETLRNHLYLDRCRSLINTVLGRGVVR
jgi:hypothetical protein